MPAPVTHQPWLGPKDDPWMRAYVAAALILLCILLAPLLPLWMALAASERGRFRETEAYLESHGRLSRRH